MCMQLADELVHPKHPFLVLKQLHFELAFLMLANKVYYAWL